MRANPSPIAFCGVLLLIATSSALADHFSFSLELSDAKGKQQAATQPARPVRRGGEARAAFETMARTPLTARWKVTGMGKAAAKDVLVHFFVVKVEQKGKSPPPLEPNRVVMESAITMDFDPADTSDATLHFRVEQAGTYLVQIETREKDGDDAHVEYAAVDLVVK